MSRRSFVASTVTAAAGLTILPGGIISARGRVAPSDKLNIAGIGIGGMGHTNVNEVKSQNIVALCDVDWAYSAQTFADYPGAKRYWDYRKMFDEMANSIDAVIIATPDHTHAITAIDAITLGKHVYVQKPLTHTVYESRMLRLKAAEYKVATQMGNQGNSGEGLRQICEWLWDGAIGTVERVHAWTNRPIWPQGLERPAKGMWVPDTLNWDLFIGPAPKRPYHEVYTPWNWRGWWDFGTGALGDMACHILDPVFMGLKLGHPVKVQASSTQFNTESPPQAEIVHYKFPAREKYMKLKMPAVHVTWYDGGFMPMRFSELKPGEMMGDGDGGVLFEGSKGKIMCGTYGKNPRLWINGTEETGSYIAPKVIRRINTTHEMDWVRACKESPENRIETSSNFNYSGPLNEMVVMGNLAVRLQDLKRELEWDGEAMKITNIGENEEVSIVKSDTFTVESGHSHFDTKHETIPAKPFAEEMIKHTYREGWKLNV
ncbi:MAG: Gfo/Idh/MocA family oxidoreductase [Bacteroidales bacterium]|nr:Gfo/Idh/MocA family oxidoreductase [Bacteroidales bacterium]MBN2698706.1 Gfo/Idh/MocA family oxidoreductase [Bacteroidales bacterium]